MSFQILEWLFGDWTKKIFQMNTPTNKDVTFLKYYVVLDYLGVRFIF